MSKPRISPVQAPFAPEVAADLAAIMPPGVPPIAIFLAAANNPRILHKMRMGNLLDAGSITRRERELVILRACARAGAEYEWGVHAAFFSARVGLGPAEVEATVTKAGADPFWPGPDGLLVRLTDALHESADVPDALWQGLAAHWTPEQLVELVMLAGQYRMIAGMVRAWRLPLEPFAPRFPARPASSPA